MSGSDEGPGGSRDDGWSEEPEDGPPGHGVIIIFSVFFEAGLAPFSLLLGWWLGHPPLARFAWSLRDAALGVAATLPLIGLFLAMLRWPIGPLAKVKELCEEEVLSLFQGSTWSDLALVALSAGVGEEMLFRGVLQAKLMDVHWLGPGGGLALASLLFGILHPITFTYAVMAWILGIYLGGLWMLDGNLLTVMVTHALYDFVALAYLIRIRPGRGDRGPDE